MRSSRFRAMSCAPRARAGSPPSGSSVRARTDRKSADAFGPDWLRQQLARLLPGFPDVALCVALSGGVDSTALIAALAEAGGDGLRGTPGLRLRALHIDHGLHPNARRWAAHCRRLARRLGIPLKVLSVKVPQERG